MKIQISFFLVVVSAIGAFAADEVAFSKANQAYAEGRFADAVTGYNNLVRAGQWHANVFYDLGNAWYRLGDLGKVFRRKFCE